MSGFFIQLVASVSILCRRLFIGIFTYTYRLLCLLKALNTDSLRSPNVRRCRLTAVRVSNLPAFFYLVVKRRRIKAIDFIALGATCYHHQANKTCKDCINTFLHNRKNLKLITLQRYENILNYANFFTKKVPQGALFSELACLRSANCAPAGINR